MNDDADADDVNEMSCCRYLQVCCDHLVMMNDDDELVVHVLGARWVRAALRQLLYLVHRKAHRMASVERGQGTMFVSWFTKIQEAGWEK